MFQPCFLVLDLATTSSLSNQQSHDNHHYNNQLLYSLISIQNEKDQPIIAPQPS
jgi:hypothetical protein